VVRGWRAVVRGWRAVVRGWRAVVRGHTAQLIPWQHRWQRDLRRRLRCWVRGGTASSDRPRSQTSACCTEPVARCAQPIARATSAAVAAGDDQATCLARVGRTLSVAATRSTPPSPPPVAATRSAPPSTPPVAATRSAPPSLPPFATARSAPPSATQHERARRAHATPVVGCSHAARRRTWRYPQPAEA
jgi:hypothetical protein